MEQQSLMPRAMKTPNTFFHGYHYPKNQRKYWKACCYSNENNLLSCGDSVELLQNVHLKSAWKNNMRQKP